MGCKEMSASMRKQEVMKMVALRDQEIRKKQLAKRSKHRSQDKNHTATFENNHENHETSIEHHNFLLSSSQPIQFPKPQENLSITNSQRKQRRKSSKKQKNQSIEKQAHKKMLLREKIKEHRSNRKEYLNQLSSDVIVKAKRKAEQTRSINNKILNTFDFANDSFGVSGENWKCGTIENDKRKKWQFGTVEEVMRGEGGWLNEGNKENMTGLSYPQKVGAKREGENGKRKIKNGVNESLMHF